jgi:phosphatidylglycerophosphate synthase
MHECWKRSKPWDAAADLGCAGMNRERLQRIRNFQSEDWWPALVIRPITIAIMLVIADWKFLTPNRLTTLANICKLVAAVLVLYPERWIVCVVLLQAGLVLDHLDGTMARYRRVFTKLGSYYDKVSDMFTWAVIMLVVGWQHYRSSGGAMYIVLAAASVIALNLRGYMKWLYQAETERLRWLEARPDPAAAVARHTEPIVVKPPPVRSTRDWAVWFAKKLAVVFIFEEADLWFWLSLGLLIDRLDLVLWVMMISQCAGAAAMVVVRAVWLARADRRIRELESSATSSRP